MAEIATVCPYCGCGCGIYIHTRDGRAVGVSPSRSHPVSQGRLCIKGWHAHELVDNPRRLTRPLIRRGGELVEASWEEAVSTVARELGGVLKSGGPQAIGVLGSARCTNEDNYALARFARGTLATPNLDCSLSIQCLPEPSPQAHLGQISDLDQSDLIFIFGDDPTEEHPAVAARIYRARERGARIITASLRKHPLARLADLHLTLRPGAEVRIIGSLLYVLLVEEGVARERAGELATLRAAVANLSPEDTEARAGVPAETLRRAAQHYLASRQVAIMYSTGLTLSPAGPAAIQALSSLAALDSPPAGPRVVLLSLLSRNNLQGCRDMGVAPDYLPGYGDFSDDAAVQKLEQAWQGKLCREAGLRAWQMLGRVKALYVMGDDVIRALPDQERTRAALEKLTFLVVQDIFLSPVASLADVVLPAAAFAERDGTWTSLEQRVQLIRRAVLSPGEAREDWRIIADVSRAMGKPFGYENARQIFEEIAGLLPIYAGVFYPPLEVHGGIRWTKPEARAARQTPPPSGRMKLDRPPLQGDEAEIPSMRTSDEYPLLLTADPTLRPWDGEVTVSQALTVAIEFNVVDKDYPGGMLCLNPEDAKRFGVRGGRNARVVSAKGERQMRVRVTDEVPEGIGILPYYQATRSGLMEISADSDTGRPMLVPTPVSVGPAE